eukprot:m.834430 g.834430  ORF g.834430 m.834430 type:complete len:800 (-) comp23448_c0_seq3:368-2767(-)
MQPSDHSVRRSSGPSTEKSGFLLKWTNYMKGYRERWFVLKNGVLSYYRSQDDVGISCRGTMVIREATVTVDTGNNFTLTLPASTNRTDNGKNSGGDGPMQSSRAFYLRAHSEAEHAAWIATIEHSKSMMQTGEFVKQQLAITTSPKESYARMPAMPSHLGAHAVGRGHQAMESASEGETSDDESGRNSNNNSFEEATMKSNLAKMNKWHSQLSDRCIQLHTQLDKGATEVPGVAELQGEAQKVQQTASALLTACREYTEQLQLHQAEWGTLIESNDAKRVRLEAQLEALAREHHALEQQAAHISRHSPTRAVHVDDAARGAGRTAPHKHTEYTLEESSNDDGSDSDEFFDAEEEQRVSMTPGRGSNESTILLPHTLSPDGTAPSSPLDAHGVNPSGNESEDNITVADVLHRVGDPQPRRQRIPKRPRQKLSLWSLIKSCVGKDLTRVAMPVNFNEPLSFAQRLCEDLEYAHLLTKAVACESSQERLVWVMAFTVSAFASSSNNRTGKPFNPLLGETFELDRRAEHGWRAVVEQVSHHPPICCMHSESDDWTYWQECSFTMKFRGKYLEVLPTGLSHLLFKKSGDHYTWTKTPTTINNIIVGKLWVDQHGKMDITNHNTGDVGTVEYIPYSYFGRGEQRKVQGKVTDASGAVHYTVHGTWDKDLFAQSVRGGAKQHLWKANVPPKYTEEMYGMTLMAMTLNEMGPVEAGCCPTDSRRRPDIRQMENQNYEDANVTKVKLEEKQRSRRREMERTKQTWVPRWFQRGQDPCIPSRSIHQYKGGYWEAKMQGEWDNVIDLYTT